MVYRFEKDLIVEGVRFRAGDTVAEKDLPAGCFESLVRQRQLVLDDTPAPEAPAVEAAAPEPKPKKK